MASTRFIQKAQAAYVAATAAGETEEARRIFRWLEAGLSGESNRTAEWVSGYSPARRDVGRSTAAMVQEVRA